MKIRITNTQISSTRFYTEYNGDITTEYEHLATNFETSEEAEEVLLDLIELGYGQSNEVLEII